MKNRQPKDLKLLKDTGLLQSDGLNKLKKAGIENADSLYLHIWVEREKIENLLIMNSRNLSFFSVFLLDYVEKDTLILIADRSLDATEKPIKIKKGK